MDQWTERVYLKLWNCKPGWHWISLDIGILKFYANQIKKNQMKMPHEWKIGMTALQIKKKWM